MKKQRMFITNKKGIAVIYDTLLFLIFVSLSGVILLPAIIPIHLSSSQEQIVHDINAEETLQLMLVSTCDEFDYTIAKEFIDPFAEYFGINTSYKKGIYHDIIQWTLGKQQQHKTFGEHLSEALFSMIEFPISTNESVQLNILTTDYINQLKKHISSYFNNTLTNRYNYHLMSTWRPIKNIKCGGLIQIGESPPPSMNTYVASQSLTIPFFPIIHVNGNIIVLSEQWFTSIISSLTDSLEICSNLTTISSNLANSYMSNDQESYFYKAQIENLTHFFIDLLFDGVYDINHTMIIPGITSLLLHSYFNNFSKTINEIGKENIENSTGYGFSSLDSFFFNFNDSINNCLTTYVKSILCDSIASYFPSISINLYNITDFLIDIIITSMKDFFEPILKPLITSFLTIIPNNCECNLILNELVSLVFSQLSLTQATVTLTIWEATI